MLAHQIFPITNFNDITYHMLSAIKATLYFKVGDLHAPNEAIADYSRPDYSSNQQQDSDFTPLQSEIVKIFRSCTLNEGLHVQTVLNSFKGRHNEQEIRSTIDSLVSEGHLYCTIDDDHFKCAYI